MKVDLIKKYKWYILGLIIAWILMAVGLSFCAWDNNSIRNLSLNGGVSDYHNWLVSDANGDNVADVGDIVTYGSYYQTAEATSKDPIRWIVVHKENGELTLLAESVLTLGSFWNRNYHNGSNWMWEDASFKQYYQNYMVSTLSMWLNSDYGARHDQGVAFTKKATKLGMRGFMNEAFTEDEIANISDREISGMQGMAQGVYGSSINTPISDYGSRSYKVWVPSWSEIYGTTTTQYGKTVDGSPNAQFEYFKGVSSDKAITKLIGKTTAFAATPGKSNYTTDKDTSHIENAQGQLVAGGAVWWWLRSPCPSSYTYALMIRSGGSGGYGNTNNSNGGVRPAICIPV